ARMPTVVTFISDAPLGSVVEVTLPLWHIDAVTGGGVHLTESGHWVGHGHQRRRFVALPAFPEH
ncbi:MAG TPA: hypothetical protein VKR31_06500, partial [Rhizomicrobium sp.]|nr:hypothetical protein [Rhizomicrobium sp.]